MSKTVIIGGGAGGMTAATHLKKISPNTEVCVIEKSPFVSWAGCPTPYYISGELPKKSVVHYSKEYFINNRGIQIYTEHIAKKIDFANNNIEISGLNLNEKLSYDNLILSLGGKPIIPKMKGFYGNLEGVFTLSHATDAFMIKEYIENNKIESCAVIGGGFIGLEMAETFSKLGLNVSIIEKADDILLGYSKKLKSDVYDYFPKKNINFLSDITVDSIESNDNRINKILLSNGNYLEIQLLLISIGKVPNIDLLINSDYSFSNPDKMVIPNSHMQIQDNIYAIGDMIFTKNLITGTNTYAPFGDVADKQGLVAAKNISNNKVKFNGVINTSATSFFEIKFARTGLTLQQATDAGYSCKEVFVKGFSKVPGFNTRGNNCEIVYDEDTNLILGAAMSGSEAVAQFIDQFSIVISYKIPILEFINIDFAYSPTNSTVWNPLLAIYRKVIK